MTAALLVGLISLALVIALPAPFCLIALAPWAFASWLCVESLRGRWNQ